MYNIATANHVVTGNMCPQTLRQTISSFSLSYWQKKNNNESTVELNKTAQFVPAAKKTIKMRLMGGCPKQFLGF